MNPHPQFCLIKHRTLVTRAAQYRQQYLPHRTALRDHCTNRDHLDDVISEFISSSPWKDLTQAENGFSSVQSMPTQSTEAFEGARGPTVKFYFPSASSTTPLSDGVSVSSLLAPASQHWTALSSLNHHEELPSRTTTQLSSALPTQMNGLSSCTSSGWTSTSTLLYTSVKSKASLRDSHGNGVM